MVAALRVSKAAQSYPCEKGKNGKVRQTQIDFFKLLSLNSKAGNKNEMG